MLAGRTIDEARQGQSLGRGDGRCQDNSPKPQTALIAASDRAFQRAQGAEIARTGRKAEGAAGDQSGKGRPGSDG